MNLKFTPEQIESFPINRLIPNARNARTHSKEQIAEIAASFQAFGFMSVVFVDENDRILSGHGRVLAAQLLGLDRVPVIVVRHLSEAEKRAFAIADNKIALNAGWNEELLRVELESLKDDGIALELVGFSEEESNSLIDRLERSNLQDEDEVPEVAEQTVTQPGDVWILGAHELTCGDATTSEAYDAVLGAETADMVFTDSPYNVAYRGPGTGATITNDNLGPAFAEFLHKACTQIISHTEGAIYICMSSSELHTLYRAFTTAGGHWSTYVVWAKNTFTLSRSDYQRQYEPILYGWPEGKSHHWCGARDQGDVWFIDKPHVNDLHPTMKPQELVERAVLNSSRRGDIVLDPFAGAGSTLIACEKTGRKARLIEIEPVYCDVMVRRWQEHTGKKAVLKQTGAPFDAVAEASVTAPHQAA
jgi:DNA modification methylase